MKNKGITLVALIITIIVLLIIAGIGVGISVGPGGIIEKAKYSKWIVEYNSVAEAERMSETKKSMISSWKIDDEKD